ncbi:MAG: hypothetical protein ACUVTQ_12380 [Desulfotomaculales bacterium]
MPWPWLSTTPGSTSNCGVITWRASRAWPRWWKCGTPYTRGHAIRVARMVELMT